MLNLDSIKIKLSVFLAIIVMGFFFMPRLVTAARCCMQTNLSSCIVKTNPACNVDAFETDCNAYLNICPQFICCTGIIGNQVICREYEKGTFDCLQAGAEWNTSDRSCESISECKISSTAPPTEKTPTIEAVTPKLQINIPGVTFTSLKFKSGETVSIPFIMQYIKGVYKYLLGVAIFLAIIMVMVAGFRWLSSGGNAATIDNAKKQIAGAVVGLILAMATNVILNTINPELIRIKGIPIQTIATEQIIQEEGDAIPEGSINPTGTPTWNYASFDCTNPPAPAGVADPRTLERDYTCPGISRQITSVPEMKTALCRAGELAQQRGYTLEVKSSYRSFEKQVNIWCGREGDCYAKYPTNTFLRKKYCAVPGFSNHGLGRAIDITLKKNGVPLYYLSSTGQCQVDPKIVEAVAKIFYDADPAWKRYEAEIWHFEYGTNLPARGHYTTLPAKCR